MVGKDLYWLSGINAATIRGRFEKKMNLSNDLMTADRIVHSSSAARPRVTPVRRQYWRPALARLFTFRRLGPRLAGILSPSLEDRSIGSPRLRTGRPYARGLEVRVSQAIITST